MIHSGSIAEPALQQQHLQVTSLVGPRDGARGPRDVERRPMVGEHQSRLPILHQRPDKAIGLRSR
jgi:hypothetical protein